jgi:hypothetical protein
MSLTRRIGRVGIGRLWMRQENLRVSKNRPRFVPFRLHLSTGAFFDIREPQMRDVRP